MPTTTTRRAIIAGLAAAPVAGLPAGAAPSDALAAAIARHKLAAAAVDAHRGPEDLPIRLADADDAALMALAKLPGDDAALLVKLRYMVENQKRRYGPHWLTSDAEEIMVALDLHLNGRA